MQGAAPAVAAPRAHAYGPEAGHSELGEVWQPQLSSWSQPWLTVCLCCVSPRRPLQEQPEHTALSLQKGVLGNVILYLEGFDVIIQHGNTLQREKIPNHTAVLLQQANPKT